MSQHTLTHIMGSAELEVTFDYTPEEPMVMHYADGSGYPGSPSEIKIIDVQWNSTNVADLLEKLGYLENLEAAAEEHMRNRNDY